MIDVFDKSAFSARVPWSSILSASCGIVQSVAGIDDEELGVPDFIKVSSSPRRSGSRP